ncbi:MAG: Nodulation protein NolV [Herbaspirillum sp.]|nr:Nodulation protein NolV [Herbaspirillum sp.]
MNRTSPIMSARAHASFLNAEQMLARSQKLADETIAAAENGYKAACDEGYQAGLEQARQQATQENIGIGLQRRQSLHALEQDLSMVVLHTLQQILGDIDCVDKVRMLVRQALTRLGKLQGDIAVHVHPGPAVSIAAELQQWNATHPAATLRAIGDPAIDIEACRVVCGSGSIEGNLQQQLAAIANALQESCTEAADRLAAAEPTFIAADERDAHLVDEA